MITIPQSADVDGLPVSIHVETMTPTRSFSFHEFSLPLIIITGLWLAANLFQIPALWGINYLSYLPKIVLYAAIVIGVLSVIPKLAEKIASHIDRLNATINERPNLFVPFGIAVAAVLAVLTVIFRQSIPLLGDGSLRANEILDGRMWQPTEMLDFLAHALLYQHVFSLMGYNVTTCYHVVSVVSGIIFVFNALWLARCIDTRRWLTYFLLFVTSGMTAQFFGYVESYSLAAAYVPFLVCCLLKITKKQIGWIGVVPVLLFGTLLHSVIFVLFLAPAIYAVLSGRVSNVQNTRNTHIILIVGASAAIIIGYVISSTGSSPFSGYLLPFTAKGEASQAIVTLRHGFNLLNWLFFAALPFLLLLPSLFRREHNDDQLTSRVRGLGFWIMISALLFIFLFRPQIGGPRDWDLFSLAAFGLITAALIVAGAKRQEGMLHHFVPILIISGSLTLSFAIINNSPKLSAARFTAIIEAGKFQSLYQEYATLFNYAAAYPELSDRRSEFGRLAWEQPPRNRQDSLYITQSLAFHHLNTGSGQEALSWISRAIQIDSVNLASYRILIEHFERIKDKPRLLKLAQRLESIFSEDADGLMQVSLIHMKYGNIEDAGPLLINARRLDRSNTGVLVNLGNYYTLAAQYDSAVSLFQQAVILDASSFAAAMGLATAQFYMADSAAANQSLNIAERLARDTQQFQKIAFLREQLNR